MTDMIVYNDKAWPLEADDNDLLIFHELFKLGLYKYTLKILHRIDEIYFFLSIMCLLHNVLFH